MTERFQIPTPDHLIRPEDYLAGLARAETHVDMTLRISGDTLPDGKAVVIRVPDILLTEGGQLDLKFTGEENPDYHMMADDSYLHTPERKRLTLRIDNALLPRTGDYDGIDYTISLEDER